MSAGIGYYTIVFSISNNQLTLDVNDATYGTPGNPGSFTINGTTASNPDVISAGDTIVLLSTAGDTDATFTVPSELAPSVGNQISLYEDGVEIANFENTRNIVNWYLCVQIMKIDTEIEVIIPDMDATVESDNDWHCLGQYSDNIIDFGDIEYLSIDDSQTYMNTNFGYLYPKLLIGVSDATDADLVIASNGGHLYKSASGEAYADDAVRSTNPGITIWGDSEYDSAFEFTSNASGSCTISYGCGWSTDADYNVKIYLNGNEIDSTTSPGPITHTFSIAKNDVVRIYESYSVIHLYSITLSSQNITISSSYLSPPLTHELRFEAAPIFDTLNNYAPITPQSDYYNYIVESKKGEYNKISGYWEPHVDAPWPTLFIGLSKYSFNGYSRADDNGLDRINLTDNEGYFLYANPTGHLLITPDGKKVGQNSILGDGTVVNAKIYDDSFNLVSITNIVTGVDGDHSKNLLTVTILPQHDDSDPRVTYYYNDKQIHWEVDGTLYNSHTTEHRGNWYGNVSSSRHATWHVNLGSIPFVIDENIEKVSMIENGIQSSTLPITFTTFFIFTFILISSFLKFKLL